jgi:DNA-binding CsgD family transcriptional regulator
MSDFPAAEERESTIRRADSELRSGNSLLLFGESGMGKSHVGREVLKTLRSSGRRVARMQPVGDDNGLLFGPYTTSLDDARRTMSLHKQSDIERMVLSESTPIVLYVDDAHALSASEAEWLSGLVRRDRVCLFATLRIDDHRNAETGVGPLTELWLQGRVVRLDLEPLDRQQTDAMVSGLTSGTFVDKAARLAIFEASGGLPIFVRELTSGVVDVGLHAGVGGSFNYPLSPQPAQKLFDLVRSRTSVLTQEDRDALVLLARLDGVPYERAAQFVGDATLRRLVNGGFLYRTPETDVVAHRHRIEAGSLLAAGPGPDLPALVGRAVDMVLRDARLGMVLHPAEYLFVAEVLSDRMTADSGDVDLDVDLASLYLVAAAQCTAMGNLHQAVAFARMSGAYSPSEEATLEESRALAGMGNYPAAAALISRGGFTDDSLPGSVAMEIWRIQLGTWTDRGGDPHPLVGHEDIDSLRMATRAYVAADWTTTVALAQPLVHSTDHELSPSIRLAATSILLPSLARLGLGAEFASARKAGQTQLARMEFSRDPYQQLATQRDAVNYFAIRALAQLMAGVDVAALEDELETALREAAGRHDSGHLALLSGLLGFSSLIKARADVAEIELRLALERTFVPPDSRWITWLVGLRASAVTELGSGNSVRELLARLQSTPFGDDDFRARMINWQYLELDQESGEPETVKQSFAKMIAQMNTFSPLGKLTSLFMVVAGGADAKSYLAEAREIRASTDLPLLDAVADYIEGVASDDADLLDSAAHTLADTGYHRFARMSALKAAELYGVSGRRVASSASRAFDQRLRGLESQHPTREPEIDLSALTAREREIILLVASGRSNKSIAEELYLSVRTVESHFYQARVKLGAPSRDELARALLDAGGVDPAAG